MQGEARIDIAHDDVESIRSEIASKHARVVVSPYRICPIGAHSDHQGGPVLGMTVDAHTLLAFAPSDGPRVELTSSNFPGRVGFEIGQSYESPEMPEWGRYAAAAAAAMSSVLPRSPRGIVGRVRGTLPGGGLSSSASVLLAYLEALAHVNGLALEAKQKMELALTAERDFVGMRVGLLDPATIVVGKKDRLIALDTETSTFVPLELGPAAPGYRILIVFSGAPRQLSATPYNNRVDECFAAVRILATKTGRDTTSGLNAFTDAELERYADELPEIPLRRARHFFTERARVRAGADAWRRGDLERFGELMNGSCRSSIENWESGSEELIALQAILEQTPGIFGSRFSGAGFGGCIVALVGSDQASDVRDTVEQAVQREMPQCAERVRVFFIGSDHGIRLL